MKLKEHNLIRYSIVVFLLCFALLIYLEGSRDIEVSLISDLDFDKLNNNILIEGKVIEQTLYNTTLFFIVVDEGKSMKAIAFDVEKELELFETYKIYGKLTLYNKEFEIIVKEIRHSS